jgi:hypothetical protein
MSHHHYGRVEPNPNENGRRYRERNEAAPEQDGIDVHHFPRMAGMAGFWPNGLLLSALDEELVEPIRKPVD